jgi:putative membrane protein
MFWYGPGMGGWGYGLAAFGSLLFWAAVIVAIVLLIRHYSRPGSAGSGFSSPGRPPGPATHGPGSAPEQLLAERFARGEIDADEYRERLRVLREAAGAKTETQP